MDVLVVTDDGYSAGASALLRSVARLAVGPVRAFVVDVGLRETGWRQVEAAGVPVVRLGLDASQTALLRSFHHDESHGHWAVYARLLLGDLLPPDVQRVTYLDSDALCLRDPTPLSRRDLGDVVLAAAQDRWVSGLHARRVLGKDPSRPLGVPAYFNSGVLEVNVAAWRRDGVGPELLALLGEHRRYPYYDQDPLNVVLAGRWQCLEPTWNVLVGPREGAPPAASLAAVEGPAARPAIRDATVVHFIGSAKPWSAAPEDFPDEVGAVVREHYDRA